MKEKCKTCKSFKSGRWHKAVDPKESMQMGGYCPLLSEVLRMDNAFLWGQKIYIQDTFGCVLHQPKSDVNREENKVNNNTKNNKENVNITKTENNTFHEPCPSCGSQLMKGPDGGVVCSNDDCGYWFCF